MHISEENKVKLFYLIIGLSITLVIWGALGGFYSKPKNGQEPAQAQEPAEKTPPLPASKNTTGSQSEEAQKVMKHMEQSSALEEEAPAPAASVLQDDEKTLKEKREYEDSVKLASKDLPQEKTAQQAAPKTETLQQKEAGPQEASVRQSYTVQPGDNVWNVAKKFDMEVRKLVKDNNLKSPYWLKVGQKLIINKNGE